MKKILFFLLALISVASWSAQSLTPREIDAIHYYTFLGYGQINPALRNGQELTGDAARHYPFLLSGLKKMPSFNGITYRSEHYNSLSDLNRVLKSNFRNNYMALNQFWSTTRDQQMVRRFCQTHNCVYYTIIGKSGRDVSALSEINDESEIIFLPGTQFKVIDSHYEGTNAYFTIQEI